MANAQNGPLSLPAAADLSGSIYCGAKLGSAGLVLPAAGEAIFGVLQSKAASGKTALVECRPGVRTIAISGGAVARGDRLKCDSAGKFLLASAQDIADGKAVAICVEGAATADKRISLVLTGGNPLTTLVASESIADDADHVAATSVFVDETLVTLGTTSFTGTLANGLFVGQKKRVRVIAASGGFTYALTPTTMQAGQPTVFTFTAKGQAIELTWSATGWVVTAVTTAGTGTTAAAGTINPLIRRQGLTVGSAGAEDRILPSGWVPGHTIKIATDTVGTGTTTISGLFYDEDGSADGIDANYNAALDEATFTWDGARWIADSIISVTISP